MDYHPTSLWPYAPPLLGDDSTDDQTIQAQAQTNEDIQYTFVNSSM